MKELITLISLLIALQATASASPLQLLCPPTDKQSGKPNAAVVEELLNTKWDRKSTNKIDSLSIFKEAPRDTPHLWVAYALNRINHGSVDQALEISSEARQRFKENWDSRIVEVWLLTLTDQYDAALVQLRFFKKQLDIAQAANRLSPGVQQKIYQRFGRLIGYLEGPVVQKNDAQLLADTTIQLEQNIDPETKKAFTLARQSVKTQYEQLLAQQVGIQNQELAKVGAVNEVEKERLEKDNQLLEITRARLVPRLEDLASEGNIQTTSLEQQIGSAGANLRTANQAAYRLEEQLAFLYTDLYSIDRRDLASAYAIQNQIFRIERELSRQRIAAANQANELSALQGNLYAVRQNYRRQIGQINNELKRTEVSQKRNGKQLQKIAAGPKIAGGKTQSLTSRRTALKTYDNLPVELYRQELLEAFR